MCEKNGSLVKKEIIPKQNLLERRQLGEPTVSFQFIILPESEYRLGLLLLLVYWSVFTLKLLYRLNHFI